MIILSASKRFRATIEQDANPFNIREECEHLFEIYHKPNRYFNFSDVSNLPDNFDSETYLIFPLFAYVHSGVSFSLSNKTYPFNDAWDAGLTGYMFASLSSIKKEGLTIEQAAKNANAEIFELNQYCNGEVFCFTIIDTEDDEIVDSCGGFYGIDSVQEEAASMLRYFDNKYVTLPLL